MKKCSKCKELQPIMSFYKDSRSKDGCRSECKDCSNLYRKELYYKNIDSERERSKDYRNNHINQSRERTRLHYQNNKEYYIRKNTERKRKLKFIPLISNPFPDEIKIAYHHINDMLVVPIPEITHKNTLGKSHRKKMSKILEKYYGLDFQKLLVQ